MVPSSRFRCWNEGRSCSTSSSTTATRARVRDPCGKYRSASRSLWGILALELDGPTTFTSWAVGAWSDPGPGWQDARGVTKLEFGNHTAMCALLADGSLTCHGRTAVASRDWTGGWNFQPTDPAHMPEGSFVDIALGSYHACAVREEDWEVVCWGWPYDGIIDFPGWGL